MIQRNSTLAVLRESFVAGSDENLSPIMHHLWKMEGGAIYFCRSGWAHVAIDLKEYEIVKTLRWYCCREALSASTEAAVTSQPPFSDFQRTCFGKPACG